jgi:hypothetical protein
MQLTCDEVAGDQGCGRAYPQEYGWADARHEHIGPYHEDSAYEEDLGSDRDIPKQAEFRVSRNDACLIP